MLDDGNHNQKVSSQEQSDWPWAMFRSEAGELGVMLIQCQHLARGLKCYNEVVVQIPDGKTIEEAGENLLQPPTPTTERDTYLLALSLKGKEEGDVKLFLSQGWQIIPDADYSRLILDFYKEEGEEEILAEATFMTHDGDNEEFEIPLKEVGKEEMRKAIEPGLECTLVLKNEAGHDFRQFSMHCLSGYLWAGALSLPGEKGEGELHEFDLKPGQELKMPVKFRGDLLQPTRIWIEYTNKDGKCVGTPPQGFPLRLGGVPNGGEVEIKLTSKTNPADSDKPNVDVMQIIYPRDAEPDVLRLRRR